MPRASLEPRQDNIQSRAVVAMDGGGYRLQWDIRLWDGRVLHRTTKGKDLNKGQVRARARETAQQLLASYGVKAEWKSTDLMGDYIESVSIPAVEQDSSLRPNSKNTYPRLLGYLAAGFKGLVVANAIRPRTVESVLNDIAVKHGTATAKHCKKVLNKWVMKKLVHDEVITHNPLTDTDITITPQVRKAGPIVANRGLTRDEYDRAFEYVLSAKPYDPKYTTPKRGHYTHEELAAKRSLILDVTLLQMATGLRISEVRELTPADVSIDGNKVTLTITPEGSKTHKGRRISILKPEVSKRFIIRFNKLPKKAAYVFHTPLNPKTIWDKSNSDKAVNRFLHNEVAIECGIDALKTQGSHTWRKTLNTFAKEKGIPQELRSAYFGHSAEVNERYYTDSVDLSGFITGIFD